MPRISGSCRNADRRSGGWTLFELLVALALIALLTALVVPEFASWRERARLREAEERVVMALRMLPENAYLSAKPQVLRSGKDVNLDLPEGWELVVQPVLVYEANGMTRGARVALKTQHGTLAAWDVLPPTGRLVRRDE